MTGRERPKAALREGRRSTRSGRRCATC